MKRSERACAITQILTENPNKDFSLGYFAEKFDCAKSSISEDIKIVRVAMESSGLGYVETTSGSKGGIRYVPYISKEVAKSSLLKLKSALEDKNRDVGGSYIYTTDLMFNPEVCEACAMQFAKRFAAVDADLVVTVETKGIGVAFMTARLLNVPLIVLRHEAKVSEGSTISINYYSGSSDRVQKMSLSKRAIKPGQKAIIIDDFMKKGGTLKGIEDMLSEFDAKAVGFGAVIAAKIQKDMAYENKISDFFALINLTENDNGYVVEINPEIIAE